jgi:hypothetical protein
LRVIGRVRVEGWSNREGVDGSVDRNSSMVDIHLRIDIRIRPCSGKCRRRRSILIGHRNRRCIRRNSSSSSTRRNNISTSRDIRVFQRRVVILVCPLVTIRLINSKCRRLQLLMLLPCPR